VVLQEGSLGPISADLGTRLVESGRRLGFELDPKARVETLTPGDRQRVEIARALMVDAHFLLLDEPTAVLSPQEKGVFFELLQRLASEGIGIIVVTHHIGDALEYGQHMTILRSGRVVGEPRQRTQGLTEAAVIQMMVGDIEFREDHRAETPAGADVVVVTDVCGQFEGERTLSSVTLTVRAGEVLGIAGVEGDGQRELAAALTGAWSPERGTVTINDRPLAKISPSDRARMIADVPDDQLLGTVAEISVWENVGLSRLSWQRRPTPRENRRLKKTTAGLVDQFGIRCANVTTPVGHLSGGNRRRVVLARELSKEPALAVLGFASKGLDVRSVEQLKAWSRRLAAAGAAVVYISADLDEVLAISDRIAVLAHGEIQGILDARDADLHRIGRLMLGGTKEAEELET
jgi:simple sugar transport system ATP-binding protein